MEVKDWLGFSKSSCLRPYSLMHKEIKSTYVFLNDKSKNHTSKHPSPVKCQNIPLVHPIQTCNSNIYVLVALSRAPCLMTNLKWFLPSKVLMGRIKIFSLTLNSATIYNKLNLKYLIPDLNDLTMEVPLPPSKLSHLLFYFQWTYSWGFDSVNVHLWWLIGYTTPHLYEPSTIAFTGFYDQVC